MTSLRFSVVLLTALAGLGLLSAQVPQLISYQGRIIANQVNFDGTGQFKFALVNADGSATYWSNDGSSTAGGEPAAAVDLPVSKGLYSVLLGHATGPGMTVLPATVFTHGDVHLRVWFSDGVNGFQQLSPDRRIAAVGYAMMAESVVDGAITTGKIADGAVTSEKLAPGVVQTDNLALGAVGNAQLANSALTITAGPGLGGGGQVPLGGSIALSNAGVLSLAGGNGITVDAASGAVTLGSSAASANTPGAIVARDASGDFSAGTITGSLNGNATTATSAASFTGELAGDITGTQAATVIAATIVTGKALTGFSAAAGSITASDTLLSAIAKLDGNAALKAPLASPTFTGSVTLPAGNATAAPLFLQSGVSLTTPIFGAVEFDGTNLFITNNGESPTRKTVAYTDSIINGSQVADGSLTATKLAAGAVGAAQLAPGAAAANLQSVNLSGVASTGLILSALENNEELENAGYVKAYGSVVVPDTWSVHSTGSPVARGGGTAIWTGAQIIVWGGRDSSLNYLNDGGRFDPETSSWSTVSATNAPTPRSRHTAIWTGTEMIVWGGGTNISGPYNNGARYNPVNDSWVTVASGPARTNHTAIWTGSEMIVWGGFDGVNTVNDGARYNPISNSWSAVSSSGAPTASSSHLAIWTGSEMIIWGGSANGCRYNPATDTWTALSTSGAPTLRSEASAVWTGHEMIVWGGSSGGTLNDGYRYNPTTDTWTPVSHILAPSSRTLHTAVWTGNEMIIYGGNDSNGESRRYSPQSDSWSVVATMNNRLLHKAIWTGREMIIWGGEVDGKFQTHTLRYTPGRVLYIYQRP